MKFDHEAFADIIGNAKFNELEERYLRDCLDKGITPRRNVLLKENDYINCKDFPESNTSPDLSTYDNRDRFYLIIPPFKTGVIAVWGASMYGWWEIKSINTEKLTMDIRIRIFGFMEFKKSKVWSETMTFTVTAGVDEQGNIFTADFRDIYAPLYDINVLHKLGWGQEDEMFWNQKTEDASISFDKFEKLIDNGTFIFMRSMIWVNLTIAKTRMTRVKGGKSTVHVESVIAEEPTRVERKIGAIKVTSINRPKKPFSTTKIREYKVATWTRCGHVRHYKSGKTVYIGETKCNRKGFGEGIKPEPAKRTINFK